MTADEVPEIRARFPLGIAMHNAIYDASVPAEPSAGDEPCPTCDSRGGSPYGGPCSDCLGTGRLPRPEGPPVPGDIPADLLAVLVNIETTPRRCEYGVGIPGFGLAQCIEPAHAIVTHHPCEHDTLGCETHVRAVVDAIVEGDVTLICMRCEPKRKIESVVWVKLGDETASDR